MYVRARAPVRVDFGGGWTDVALFARDRPGYVVNAAINLYSYVTVRPPDSTLNAGEAGLRHEQTLPDRSVTIYSSDYDVRVQAEDIRQLEYDGNVDLVKAAILRLELDTGLVLITQSNAPPGSGLGTSASMGVALLAALARYSGRHFLKYELAELAQAIETQELKIRAGKQDHYASAVGGLSFMEFRGEEVKCSPLTLSRNVLRELEKNLLLCYTGTSRLSGDIHEKVTGAFLGGERGTVDAIATMKDVTVAMKDALLAGDLAQFAALMNENWRQQKRLHPSVTNAAMDALFDTAMAHGALGGKACGAGGGGCVLFYCQPDGQHRVRKAVAASGAQVIDFQFDTGGVETWKTVGPAS